MNWTNKPNILGGRDLTVSSEEMELLEKYVATYKIFDELLSMNVSEEMQTGEEYATMMHWSTKKVATEPSELAELYRSLLFCGFNSTCFPPLYEKLILSFRWAEVELDCYRLIANDTGKDLLPLFSTLRNDRSLYDTLLPNGYFQFAKAPDADYDPVCFDFRHRQKNGDCRIVRIDHEGILCYGRIKEVEELAPNFRTLLLNTISKAPAFKLHRDSKRET